MAVVTALSTRYASDNGAIARDKNTRRVFVPPAAIQQVTVTGTWALSARVTDVVALGTADCGTTNVFHIPFPTQFSDFNERGGSSGLVDRGVQVMGLEVMYEVAASDLASIALIINNVTFSATGLGAAVALTTTTSFNSAEATGLTQANHRIIATVAVDDRLFVDAGRVPYGKLSIEDGTASDCYIFGAIWHLRIVEE